MHRRTQIPRRRLLRAAGGAAGALALAGCTGGADDSDGGGDSDGGDGTVHSYNFATASSGGAWEVQGAGLANMWNELDDVQVTAINTAGGSENPVLVDSGEAGLAFQSGSNLYAVLNGEGPYDEPIELQSVFRTNTNPVWYAAHADSDMRTLADLDGRRVGVGPQGSNGNYESGLFFDHLGIDVREEYLSFTDAASAMANGQIDAMLVYGLLPAVQQLAQQADIRPLEYGDAYDSMLGTFPWAVESAFPAGAVDWWDEETPMVGKDVFVVTRPDVPEEFTFTIARRTFEEVERARDIHVLFSGLLLEEAARDLDGTIEIHPGSARYFEEAGVL